MLREHINEIMIRWSPKERRGAAYDPIRFLETPEQARKLILHLEQELSRGHGTTTTLSWSANSRIFSGGSRALQKGFPLGTKRSPGPAQ